MGHAHQTAKFFEKREKFKQFLKENDDKQKIAFLKENKIDYLFFEKKESNLFNLKEKSYLKEVFNNNLITIYKVNFAKNSL